MIITATITRLLLGVQDDKQALIKLQMSNESVLLGLMKIIIAKHDNDAEIRQCGCIKKMKSARV